MDKISTKDKLPEVDFYVICYDKYGHSFIGCLTKQNFWKIRYGDGTSLKLNVVKEWCAIP